MISLFYVAGGVFFLLVLHFWHGVIQVVHHNLRRFFLQQAPNIMVKHTRLGNLKYWLLWAVYDKRIFRFAVVGHKVIFLDQAKVYDVIYSLGVISDMIGISGEFTNFVGECHTCIIMDT